MTLHDWRKIAHFIVVTVKLYKKRRGLLMRSCKTSRVRFGQCFSTFFNTRNLSGTWTITRLNLNIQDSKIFIPFIGNQQWWCRISGGTKVEKPPGWVEKQKAEKQNGSTESWNRFFSMKGLNYKTQTSGYFLSKYFSVFKNTYKITNRIGIWVNTPCHEIVYVL